MSPLISAGSFLDQQGRFKRHSQYVMQAFNSGYRMCLGSVRFLRLCLDRPSAEPSRPMQTLAIFEAMAVTAAILGRWDVRLEPGTEPPKPGGSLTLPIANPYRVRLHPHL